MFPVGPQKSMFGVDGCFGFLVSGLALSSGSHDSVGPKSYQVSKVNQAAPVIRVVVPRNTFEGNPKSIARKPSPNTLNLEPNTLVGPPPNNSDYKGLQGLYKGSFLFLLYHYYRVGGPPNKHI